MQGTDRHTHYVSECTSYERIHWNACSTYVEAAEYSKPDVYKHQACLDTSPISIPYTLNCPLRNKTMGI